MFGFGKKTKELESELASLREELSEFQNSPAAMLLSEGNQGSELFELLTGGLQSSAGVVVNEKTAMRVSAVYACVRLIAGAIANLPLPVYTGESTNRKQVKHPIATLLNREPTPGFTAATFWEYIISSSLLSTDGLAEIKRTAGGKITGFVPLHPRSVDIIKHDGRLVYTIYPDGGDAYSVDQDDMLHIPGFGFDGVRGMSVVQYVARQGIGISIAAEDYSGEFFSNGARPDFCLQTDANNVGEDTAKVLRSTWQARHQGKGNRHLPAVLTGGLKVQQITMSAEDAQLLATRQWQVIDIARAFGVPPFMIGEMEKTTSWGSGVETMGIGFLLYTLLPHLNRAQQEINRKCFSSERFFVEFNVDGLLRGDSKTRHEIYRKALGGSAGNGYMTVNEVRAKENLPPKDGGDELTKWVPNKQDKKETDDEKE